MGNEELTEEEKRICAESGWDGLLDYESNYVITVKHHSEETYIIEGDSEDYAREQAEQHVIKDFREHWEDMLANHVTIEVKECKGDPRPPEEEREYGR